MHKKTIRGLILAGALLFIGSAAVVGLFYLPTLVTPQVVPTSRAVHVNLADLLLNLSSMPPNTKAPEGPKKMPRDADIDLNSEDNLAIFFNLSTDHGGYSEHFLYKFRDSVEARSKYQGSAQVAYLSDIYDWHIPEKWTYTSPTANQFMFRCGTDEFFQVTRCTALARYHEIISEFSTPLVPGVMELKDVERILREIDSRMEKHLR